MNILVIGSGGREHAIAKKFKESLRVTNVYVAPGNAGMQRDGIKVINISENDFAKQIEFAKTNDIQFTFVGPETPLANGIVDEFEAAELKIFGPNKEAAQIESSKQFAKKLMEKYHIPTAEYTVFDNYEEAKAFLEKQGAPIVLKADGLAAGKGVTVALNENAAQSALADIFDGKFCNGEKPLVVFEEFLTGPEFSLFSFVYKGKVHHSIPARDHKRAYEFDQGPNTGGMGAYSPVSFVTDEVYRRTINEIVQPTLDAMEVEGYPFNGVLFTGLILTEEGPKVIEYNARLGDPETQVILPLLETDFADSIDDLVHGRKAEFNWNREKVSLGVVVAADGYPVNAKKDIELDVKESDKVNLLFAGVKTEKDDRLVSNGGRIYLVNSVADSFTEAKNNVYSYLDSLDLTNTFHRKDIADSEN